MTIRSIATVRGPQLVAGGPTTFVVTAPFAPRSQLATSSNSTATLSTGGPITFAVQTAGFSIAPGQRIRVSVDGSTTEWMEGIVTAFDGPTVTFDPDAMAGTGTYSDWNIGVAGERGAQGAAGPQGPAGPQGIIPEAPTDGKYYARRTSGTAGWYDIGVVYARLDSPAFINTPTAPTAPNATNTTQIATTAFVKATSQPLDADLTSLAAASAIGAIYYRSAADTWGPVTIGTGLSFSAGTLANVASGGNVTAVGTPTSGLVAVWTSALTIQGLSPTAAGIATLASPVFTGDPQAPTPVTSDNDNSIATTAYVKANLATYQPYDGDLVALAAVSATNAIVYRSGTDTWSPVTVQSPLSFSGGVLSTLAGGGNVVSDGSPTNGQLAQWLSGTQVKGIDVSSLGLAPIASPNFSGSPTAPTPTPTTDSSSKLATTQFVSAAVALIPRIVTQTFTASGVYTPTSGMKYAVIECVGGGGGGGGINGTANDFGIAGGGGSGGYSRKSVSAATVGANQTVTIGTGGTAGPTTGGGGNGGAGGATSVGTLCVANGGGGGIGWNGNTGGGAGGAIAGAVGDMTAAGTPGMNGASLVGTSGSAAGGAGGSSVFGGGAPCPPLPVNNSTAGNAGSNYGGGGSAATFNKSATNKAGGAGAPGFVIIREYL